MGSLAAVIRRTGFVMLTAEWGIAKTLSALVPWLELFYKYGKIDDGVKKSRKPTIFVCKIQVAVESSIMVQAGIVATLVGCEDAIVDISVLQEEKNSDC